MPGPQRPTRLRSLMPEPPPNVPRVPLPKSDPNSPEALILDFLTGLTGLPMGDAESKAGSLGEGLGYIPQLLAPIAGVSVFAKGMKGGKLAADELKMMHGMQAKVSMEDLDQALKSMQLIGNVSKGQKAKMLEIANQNPRVMAHLIERQNVLTGEMNPRVGMYPGMRESIGGVAGVAPHPGMPGRGTMGFDPTPSKNPVNDFAEELAHMAQFIGLKEHALPLYHEANKMVGYGRNPFEINAKITANKLAPSMMDRVKDLVGMGPSSVKQSPLLKQLQEIGVLPKDIPEGEIMKYLNDVAVPYRMRERPLGVLLPGDDWVSTMKAVKPPEIKKLGGGF